MVDIQTISIVIASASVVAGVIYYSLMIRNQSIQIQHQNKIRETELLVRIHPWLNVSSNELQKAYRRVVSLEFTDYEDFVKKYGNLLLIKPEQEAYTSAVGYFDGLGVLVRRGLVDADLIYKCWTGDIATFWEKVKPLVEATRKTDSYPLPLYLNAEYLYNEMKKREKVGAKSG